MSETTEVPIAPMSARLAAELVGTFALVFAGTGAIVVDAQTGALGNLGIALAFGMVVAAVIYSVGPVSGAHINPAVTVGLTLARRFPMAGIAPYVLAQCAGAVAGSLLLRALFPGEPNLGTTEPTGPVAQSLVLEFVLTAMLMFTILSVTLHAQSARLLAGAVIGGVVGLGALFAGPICGASMNPARSLGPALVSDRMSDLWIYLLAPVAGAVAAVVVCCAVQGPRCCGVGGRALAADSPGR